MTTGAHVLEIGDATIGIVVQAEDRHVRFFSAGAPYDRLDGQLFRDAREVLAAARALVERPVRQPRGIAQRH